MWIVNRNGDVCGIDEIELNGIFNCICFDMCLNSGYVDVYIENSIEIDLFVDTDIQRKAERAGKVKRFFPSA